MHDAVREKKYVEDELAAKMSQLYDANKENNNADSIVFEENSQLRDANGRLKISYSKLKTDYTQIVDDLR